MPFSKYHGIFTSTELALLQRVFDQLCNEHRLGFKDADQRDQLARQVILTFESGFTDEAGLWLALSKRGNI